MCAVNLLLTCERNLSSAISFSDGWPGKTVCEGEIQHISTWPYVNGNPVIRSFTT